MTQKQKIANALHNLILCATKESQDELAEALREYNKKYPNSRRFIKQNPMLEALWSTMEKCLEVAS